MMLTAVQKEWLMIASMAVGGIGFAIGGTGFRFVRFAIMPLLLGVICYFAGIVWWRDLCFAASAGGVLTLGYGHKIPYWRKALVFLGYALVTLWIGVTWWQVILPPVVLLLFFLSNWKPTASIFLWKIDEYLFGSLIGITIASIIGR